MSILSAIKEARHESNNLEDLAKLPQTLIMSMVQNGQIEKDMLMPILGKKAEMADNTAKMNAAKALAAQGGAQPTVMDQYMGKIAQAENPAPAMPQQQMQQPMPQEMAQAPMAQGPEDVGIASQMTAPMQLAGGGIIAFDNGGDVDLEDDDYQEMVDAAQEDSMNDRLYEMIAGLKGRDAGENRGVGIRAESRGAERGMEEKGDLESRLRAVIMQRESGGRRYDKDGNLLTSSKGAQGEMQVMPATARDPGFGIKAARNNNPDELRRVGDEYASMLLNRYQDPKLAMIAYNMGPGATDKWLAAGADIRKLPKETQGYIRGVNLASGGEVRHYDIGGEIDTVGAELDALRSGADSLYQELMRGGSRGGAKTPELQAAYDNALKLRRQKEAEYQALMAKGGVDKPAFFPQSSLSTKRPEANPIVKREATKAAVAAPIEPVKSAPTGKSEVPVKDTKAEIPQSSEGIKNLQAKADDENYNLMQYIKERGAKMDAAEKKDLALAGLAAGLGMLGGESQYWNVNVGRGGQAGVQQLAASQKTRAAQEAALGKLYGSAAQADLMNKLRRDQLGQSADLARERMDQSLLTNKNAFIKDRLARAGLNEQIIQTLKGKQLENKLSPEEARRLALYEGEMKKIYTAADKMYASPRSSSGVIKLD